MNVIEILEVKVRADFDIARRALADGCSINDALSILESDVIGHVREV
jgi:hypothetical protein